MTSDFERHVIIVIVGLICTGIWICTLLAMREEKPQPYNEEDFRPYGSRFTMRAMVQFGPPFWASLYFGTGGR
jgi:hypothetical protein